MADEETSVPKDDKPTDSAADAHPVMENEAGGSPAPPADQEMTINIEPPEKSPSVEHNTPAEGSATVDQTDDGVPVIADSARSDVSLRDSSDVNKDEKTEPKVSTAPAEPKHFDDDMPDLSKLEDIMKGDLVDMTQASTGMTPRPAERERPPLPATPDLVVSREFSCTVKVMLLPSGQVHTMRSPLQQTLREIKEYFARELKIPSDSILLMFNGKAMPDGAVLTNLGVGNNGTLQLEITSSDPNNPIKALPQRVYQMPDVITVRVQTDAGEFRDVVVEIERASGKKPFLGGYRHKKTGAEYLHASAQTSKKPKSYAGIDRYCRETQTTEIRNTAQQTTNQSATQMIGIGMYVSNMEDKLMVPGKYIPAEVFNIEVEEQILIIQKYFRRWLAENYVIRVRDDLEQRMEWERKEQERKQKEKEERIRREFERRMNPKTKEDFDLLYTALEKWRLEELQRINETLSGPERKAALCQLLEQETNLIAAIGRHKNDADKEMKIRTIQAFLNKASAPKRWKGHDNKQTEMDTPFTLRAAELKEIYNSINMKYLTQDERLDVLLTLKHTVREHHCKLTQDIIELIDREADLLMRGVKENNLDGLRQRISTLFLQYIKTPTFNPEAARLIKVPQDPMTLRKDIYYCSCCCQYKSSTEFHLSTNSKNMGHCRACQKVDGDARIRMDLSMYRYMLKQLRKTEDLVNDGSQIPFLLQEGDVRYLVENVWNQQSVLSAESDLYDLVLLRWDRRQHWSPWNCILLTKEEAAAHEKLVKLEDAYGKPFIQKVELKHTLARNYFARLPVMAEIMNKKTYGPPDPPSVNGTAIATAVH